MEERNAETKRLKESMDIQKQKHEKKKTTSKETFTGRSRSIGELATAVPNTNGELDISQ